jgi:unsaturated rhamnogalacturonyl hydrolase
MRYQIFYVLLLSLCGLRCEAQKSVAVRMAETVMRSYPDSIVVRKYVTHGASEEKIEEKKPSRPASWDYEQGVVLKGFDRLWQETHDRRYLTYMKKIMDIFVNADGSIRTYDITEYNIDDITPGRILLTLYQETKEEKYKTAAAHLREQLNWQPRTKEGGFWHKHRYPYQMWLDGLYMAEPFYAEFTRLSGNTKNFDDIANQFIWTENHTRDAKTGLLYHGWDESKKQQWSNPVTGQSPEFWSRAMGWYAMAIVDVLDYFPSNHPKRKELIAILKRLSTALKNYQADSGVWYQITDKQTVNGNYPEASATCMIVYALAKGVRLGYLDESFRPVAKNGYDGILKNFIETDKEGYVHLVKTCSGAGLGGSPYRDGTFAYYIKEPLRTDDLKGIGPFIQAAVEIELMSK